MLVKHVGIKRISEVLLKKGALKDSLAPESRAPLLEN